MCSVDSIKILIVVYVGVDPLYMREFLFLNKLLEGVKTDLLKIENLALLGIG